MRISVVIPAYNREETIINCLDSIVNQTYKPYEIIVVDDGSTDRTVDLVEEYAKFPVKLIKSGKNAGAQAARNIGIKTAQGDWIAFNDSDDIWLPEKLSIQKEALEQTGYLVCAGGGIREEQDGQRSEISLNGKDGNIYKDILGLSIYLMYPTILVHKSVLEKIEYLDEKVVAYQELDTAIRIAQNNDIAYINQPLFIYNIHDTIFRNQKRGLAGIRYLFDKFYGDIVKECGREGLAKWYEKLSYNYGRTNWRHYWFLFLSFFVKII